MKNNIRIAALVALGLASVSAAQAGDLLLGFNDAAGPSAAQNDYVIDLGLSGTTLLQDAAANNGTYNLGTIINGTTFASAFSADSSYLTGSSDVAAGVVGGTQGSPNILFQTSTGTPTGAATQFAKSNGDAQTPTAGVFPSGSGLWSSVIAVSPSTPGTEVGAQYLANQTGNPEGFLNAGTLSIALWENTLPSGLGSHTTGWVDEGTLTINANDDTVTFSTPSAVPEPATYGLLSGAGLLVLGLRRQLGLKKA